MVLYRAGIIIIRSNVTCFLHRVAEKLIIWRKQLSLTHISLFASVNKHSVKDKLHRYLFNKNVDIKCSAHEGLLE